MPRSESAESQSRRLSISLSQSIDNCKDFCRATYDYDATGRDEITFEEGDTIRILGSVQQSVSHLILCFRA